MHRPISLFVLLIALSTVSAFAQSGRRQPTPTPAPTPGPVNAPKPVTSPIPGSDTPEPPPPPKHNISSLIAVGEIIHDSLYFKSSLLNSTLKDFVHAMKFVPRPFLNVDRAGKMTLDEAKARAKNETSAHVIWLGFVTENSPLGEMDLRHVDFAVIVPRTGHILFSGQIVPGRQQVVAQGGVMTIPRTGVRRSLESDMEQGAREVTYRLKSTGWLCYKTPC